MIARERLITRLLDARRNRCIAVTGPAGCGKTALLVAWRQALVPLGFDVAWLSLTPDDNELARFLEGLVAAFAEVDPALAEDAAQLGTDGIDSDAVERLAIALVRRIAIHPRELVLVLDDLHHVTHAGIHEALQWLLDFAPNSLHLVLASRGTLRLSLDRLRGQAQTLELDLRDLRFSQAETDQFLKARIGEIDRRTAKVLHELTDGWVAGLQLFAIDWKKKRREPGRAGETFARVPMRDAGAFTRYFEHEVLSTLSQHEVDALVCLAPCSRFSASLCAELMAQPHAAVDAAALLARLENDDLFVVPVDGRDGRSGNSRDAEAWFSLHPLLRETLLARFAALDEARQQDLHARAWVWFRDHGHLDEAVRHAVLAGAAAQGADLVEQCAQSLFVRGERRTLITLLRLLPPEQVERSFTLRLWTARSQLYLRELDACAKSLDRLEAEVPRGDAAKRFHLALVRAALAVQRDDSDGALQMLPLLLETPPDADALAIGGRNNILSWLYMHRGDYEKARHIQLDAPRLLVDGVALVGTAAGSLHGRCLMGLSYVLEGQMTQAERIYRAVIAEAEQGGRACETSYYLAIALLADVLYELGDAQQARALLESRLDALEHMSIPDSVLRVLRLLSAAQWQAGNRLEAFAYLERLEGYAVKHGLDRLLAHSLADTIQRHLSMGSLMAAEGELARLEAVDARHPDAEFSALGEIGLQTERSRVRLALARGDLDGAASRLNALVASNEARGRQRIATQLLMMSAAVDARRGRADEARKKVLDALRRGHRLGLLRSLLDADPVARKLIEEVRQTEALDPVLAFYVDRLQSSHAPGQPAAAAPAAARPAAAAEIEAFSERETDVLRLLAQAMPNKKIARALGLSPETVKWYLSRIYGKLQVAGRDEAVARVRDLGLGG